MHGGGGDETDPSTVAIEPWVESRDDGRTLSCAMAPLLIEVLLVAVSSFFPFAFLLCDRIVALTSCILTARLGRNNGLLLENFCGRPAPSEI